MLSYDCTYCSSTHFNIQFITFGYDQIYHPLDSQLVCCDIKIVKEPYRRNFPCVLGIKGGGEKSTLPFPLAKVGWERKRTFLFFCSTPSQHWANKHFLRWALKMFIWLRVQLYPCDSMWLICFIILQYLFWGNMINRNDLTICTLREKDTPSQLNTHAVEFWVPNVKAHHDSKLWLAYIYNRATSVLTYHISDSVSFWLIPPLLYPQYYVKTRL